MEAPLRFTFVMVYTADNTAIGADLSSGLMGESVPVDCVSPLGWAGFRVYDSVVDGWGGTAFLALSPAISALFSNLWQRLSLGGWIALLG